MIVCRRRHYRTQPPVDPVLETLASCLSGSPDERSLHWSGGPALNAECLRLGRTRRSRTVPVRLGIVECEEALAT